MYTSRIADRLRCQGCRVMGRGISIGETNIHSHISDRSRAIQGILMSFCLPTFPPSMKTTFIEGDSRLDPFTEHALESYPCRPRILRRKLRTRPTTATIPLLGIIVAEIAVLPGSEIHLESKTLGINTSFINS